MEAPIATDSGKAITGWVKMWFISEKPVQSFAYVGGYTPSPIPHSIRIIRRTRSTERAGIFAPSKTDSTRRLAVCPTRERPGYPGHELALDVKSLTKAGLTYGFHTKPSRSPVAGLGLAAVRDVASMLKFGSAPIAPGRYAYMYGSSQTGRYIRR